MTIHTKQVYRVRIAEEAAFAVDQSGTMSAFEPLDFTSATVSYDLPNVSAGVMQSKMDSSSNRVNLLKRATLTLTCNLTGAVSRAGDGTTHTQAEQGKLFRSWLGGRRLGQGDLVAASSTESVIELDAIARWEAGAGIAIANSDGRIIARQIVDVVGGDATVWPPLETADIPGDGDTAYAAQSYYLGPSADDDTDNTTLQIACEGLSDADRFLLLGGKVTGVTFNLTRGQIATATYTIQCANWIYGAAAATDLTADTAPLTYDSNANNGLPLPVVDSDLIALLEEVGETAIPLHADSLQIRCQTGWTMVNSTSGPSGCGAIGWARNPSADGIGGSFTVPFEDTSWMDARDFAGDDDSYLFLHFQLGSTLDGVLLFNIKSQVSNVQPVEASGLSYQRVEFTGGQPITTDTTDINDSPFTLHMF